MRTLDELLLDINPRPRKILVTGPQRSGSTIAAKIIGSYDGGTKVILEEEIDVDNLELFFDIHRRESSYVMQAPGLSFICHRLPVDLVVFMHRDIDDIQASEKRIGWDKEWAWHELEKYPFSHNTVAMLKYRDWDEYQKPYMNKNSKEFFDLDYESLKGHPLWVDKELRKDFKPRQTK